MNLSFSALKKTVYKWSDGDIGASEMNKTPSFGGGKQDMKKVCLKTSTLDPRHQHGSQKSLESFQMLPLEVQLPKKFFGFFCFLHKALLRACSFKNVHRIATSFSLVPLKSSLIQNSFTRCTSINPSSILRSSGNARSSSSGWSRATCSSPQRASRWHQDNLSQYGKHSTMYVCLCAMPWQWQLCFEMPTKRILWPYFASIG